MRRVILAAYNVANDLTDTAVESVCEDVSAAWENLFDVFRDTVLDALEREEGISPKEADRSLDTLVARHRVRCPNGHTYTIGEYDGFLNEAPPDVLAPTSLEFQNTGTKLLLQGQGKLFEVVHIATTLTEANAFLKMHPDTGVLDESREQGFIFIAKKEAYNDEQ